MKPCKIMISLAILSATAACGPEFDPVSLINDYRAVALAVDAPETVPDAVITARLVDADPIPRTPGPVHWSVCPFSFGGVSGYACLVPETELRVEDVGPDFEVDLSDAPFGETRGLRAALEPVAEALTAQTRRFAPDAPPVTAELLLLQGVDVWLKVESGPEARRQLSVRRVRITAPPEDRCALARQLQSLCAGGGPCPEGLDVDWQVTVACESPVNLNPGLALFEVAGLDENGLARAGGTLTLKVLPVEGARQPFYLDLRGAKCPDSDGVGDVRGGPCVEELFYRWYTTAGELKPGVSFESARTTQRETVLSLPTEPGPLEVLVVAYDGRGGVTALRRSLQIVAAD